MRGVLSDSSFLPNDERSEFNMTDMSAMSMKPSDEAVLALRENWRWLLGDGWQPLMFSAIGDVFFSVSAGSVWWLSTATGSLEQVAASHEHFLEMLEGESVDEWFLPGLVKFLRSQGKILGVDQCYSYAVFPVFEHGSFSYENMHAASAAEHFSLSGKLFESIRQLPDGADATIVLPALDNAPLIAN
jgi:hypothetical protein